MLTSVVPQTTVPLDWTLLTQYINVGIGVHDLLIAAAGLLSSDRLPRQAVRTQGSGANDQDKLPRYRHRRCLEHTPTPRKGVAVNSHAAVTHTHTLTCCPCRSRFSGRGGSNDTVPAEEHRRTRDHVRRRSAVGEVSNAVSCSDDASPCLACTVCGCRAQTVL